jgi:hemerythrin-like domain-containing protein
MPMPVGPLMTEYRLIEKLIELIKLELDRIKKEKEVHPQFIIKAVDFIQVCADQLQHGKEEDILFRDLKAKDLSPEHSKMIEEVVAKHAQSRHKTTAIWPDDLKGGSNAF